MELKDYPGAIDFDENHWS